VSESAYSGEPWEKQNDYAPDCFCIGRYSSPGRGRRTEKWYPDSMFRTKAECLSSMKERLASERIHRVRFECIPYAATKKPVPYKDWHPDPDMYK
jgi:hypothetical protein